MISRPIQVYADYVGIIKPNRIYRAQRQHGQRHVILEWTFDTYTGHWPDGTPRNPDLGHAIIRTWIYTDPRIHNKVPFFYTPYPFARYCDFDVPDEHGVFLETCFKSAKLSIDTLSHDDHYWALASIESIILGCSWHFRQFDRMVTLWLMGDDLKLRPSVEFM